MTSRDNKGPMVPPRCTLGNPLGENSFFCGRQLLRMIGRRHHFRFIERVDSANHFTLVRTAWYNGDPTTKIREGTILRIKTEPAALVVSALSLPLVGAMTSVTLVREDGPHISTKVNFRCSRTRCGRHRQRSGQCNNCWNRHELSAQGSTSVHQILVGGTVVLQPQ